MFTDKYHWRLVACVICGIFIGVVSDESLGTKKVENVEECFICKFARTTFSW